jgi:hypothetical protein
MSVVITPPSVSMPSDSGVTPAFEVGDLFYIQNLVAVLGSDPSGSSGGGPGSGGDPGSPLPPLPPTNVRIGR